MYCNRFAIAVFILLLSGSCGNGSSTRQPVAAAPAQQRFERVSDALGNGTSLIMNRESGDPNVSVGDFLSRIWYYYGKPAYIGFEGFGYTFRDRKTGLLFTAYAAGSGPAYGGDEQLRDRLLPVLKDFDQLLQVGRNADCSIEYQTDFGLMKAGARNGVPFETSEGS